MWMLDFHTNFFKKQKKKQLMVMKINFKTICHSLCGFISIFVPFTIVIYHTAYHSLYQMLFVILFMNMLIFSRQISRRWKGAEWFVLTAMSEQQSVYIPPTRATLYGITYSLGRGICPLKYCHEPLKFKWFIAYSSTGHFSILPEKQDFFGTLDEIPISDQHIFDNICKTAFFLC